MRTQNDAAANPLLACFSAKQLKIAYAARLSGADWAVWSWVMAHAVPGTPRPSTLAEIAAAVGRSTDSVARALRELGRLGLVVYAAERGAVFVCPDGADLPAATPAPSPESPQICRPTLYSKGEAKQKSFNLGETGRTLVERFGIYEPVAARLVASCGEERVAEVIAWADWLGGQLRNAGGWVQDRLRNGRGAPDGFYAERERPAEAKPVTGAAPPAEADWLRSPAGKTYTVLEVTSDGAGFTLLGPDGQHFAPAWQVKGWEWGKGDTPVTAPAGTLTTATGKGADWLRRLVAMGRATVDGAVVRLADGLQDWERTRARCAAERLGLVVG